MIRLIVNADDFGFTRDVNAGVIACHRDGILTSTTIMANGPAFEHAAGLALENPTLDVGCHLVLIGGNSVLDPSKPLPSGLPEFLIALARKKIRVRDELRAQVRRILNAGLRPTHLDTHKHTHLAPPVLDAVAELAQEFSIPWVRRPFDFGIAGSKLPLQIRLANTGIRLMRGRFARVLSKAGCHTTDHFAGFQLTGRLQTQELVAVLEMLPDGLTEFMCHPGFCTDELRGAKTRLKESRERELRALISPEARKALEQRGIELVTFQ